MFEQFLQKIIPIARAACDPASKFCVPDKITGPTSVGQVVNTVSNLLLWVVGVVAVIMIIIAGFLYVTSGGDPSRTKTAKDTILYAIIGVVVALLAYAIVNFVLGKFK